MEALLTEHLRAMLPGVGAPVRSVRCQYTLTPDRDFVIAPVPGHERVVVGLGAAHGFKFVPTFGRVLADLVDDRRRPTTDVSPFRLDRPALTDPDYAAALAGVRCRRQSRVVDVHAELDGELRGHPARAAARG